MPEKKSVLDKKFSYSGLFSVKDLYKLIRNWLSEKDYDVFEADHTQDVFEDGKQILILLVIKRKISDYAQIGGKIKIAFKKIEDVVVEQNSHNAKLSKGAFEIKFEILLVTDYEKSWENNAVQYFLRAVMDKFVFKSYIRQAEDQATTEFGQLEKELRSYLNTQIK